MAKRVKKDDLRKPQYSLFDAVEYQKAPRVLLVEFFHWAFASSALDTVNPLAVVSDKGVVDNVSPRAAEIGIKVGDKVRTSLSIAPDLVVLPVDAIDSSGLFAKMANVLEQFSPLVEIIDVGICATNAKGPSRYFGGERNLIFQVREAISKEIVKCFPMVKGLGSIFRDNSLFSFGVSIADGVFAARIAARDSLLIEPGESGGFLRPFPVTELPDKQMADTLTRLGVHSLGEFADLDFHLVMQRFGSRGAVFHRMAGGLDTSSLQPTEIIEDFRRKVELEVSLDVASAVVFACKNTVDEMLSLLLEKGYFCQIMRIRLVSENGEESVRDWGVKNGFSLALLLERVRWQIEAWSSDPRLAPSAGVEVIELIPQRMISSHWTQLGLDGSDVTSILKVSQALSRVDAIVGGRASFAKIKGSRTPKGSVEMIPWQLYLFDSHVLRKNAPTKEVPWPGKILGAAPAICFDPEIDIELLTQGDRQVGISADAMLQAEPYWMKFCGSERKVRITRWSSPWPLMERWWDGQAGIRVARMQIISELGAFLIKISEGKWLLEGSYD